MALVGFLSIPGYEFCDLAGGEGCCAWIRSLISLECKLPRA